MFMRLFLILLIGFSSFLSKAYSSTFSDLLLEGYYKTAEVRYPCHLFTVNGVSVEGAEKIEEWHIAYTAKVKGFSENTFGKLEGRNWAFASIAAIYQQDEGVFGVSDIHTLPYIFGSGVRVNMPEPSNADQHVKQTKMTAESVGFNLFFADDERPGTKSSDRLAHFIQEVETLVIPHISLFVNEYRSEAKIREAFEAWRGGSGDKNLCRNWLTDSEQVVLSYIRRHGNNIIEEHLRPSIMGNPVFFLLNIVTLNDMCGICFRSVYIQSKIGVNELSNPLICFVTGIFPYHSSREGLTFVSTLADLSTTSDEGTLVIRNIEGDSK